MPRLADRVLELGARHVLAANTKQDRSGRDEAAETGRNKTCLRRAPRYPRLAAICALVARDPLLGVGFAVCSCDGLVAAFVVRRSRGGYQGP